jgi:hypothetical protein
MASWKLFTFAGLLLNLDGVILLFLYVLPRRERTGGITGSWARSEVNQVELRLERRWDFLSAIGLSCVIIGIALQGFGIWLSP